MLVSDGRWARICRPTARRRAAANPCASESPCCEGRIRPGVTRVFTQTMHPPRGSAPCLKLGPPDQPGSAPSASMVYTWSSPRGFPLAAVSAVHAVWEIGSSAGELAHPTPSPCTQVPAPPQRCQTLRPPATSHEARVFSRWWLLLPLIPSPLLMSRKDGLPSFLPCFVSRA